MIVFLPETVLILVDISYLSGEPVSPPLLRRKGIAVEYHSSSLAPRSYGNLDS
jgi:hypothetical protein